MSAKLLLHTLMCLALAGVLCLHVRAGRRRISLSVLAAAALWLAVAPFLYRAWPGWIFPRITLSWAHLAFVGAALVAFTPRPGQDLRERADDGLDCTAPAPLEPPQHERYPGPYH